MKRKIWIVTADRYDKKNMFPHYDNTKRGAIKGFINDCWGPGKTWKQLKQMGRRCVPATVSWQRV